MRADAIHGVIARAMQRKGQIETFPELVSLVSQCKHNIQAIVMTEHETRPFASLKRPSMPMPALSQFKAVCFTKGSKAILFQHRLDTSGRSYKLIEDQSPVPAIPAPVGTPRGISSKKKDGIVHALVPLIAAENANFWMNLPVAHISEFASSDSHE